jgi:hypothetical protein
MSRIEWGVFLKAWFWLLYFDLSLRSRPYTRVQQLAEGGHPRRKAVPAGQAWEIIRRERRLVMRAARNHLYPMSCLRQALTLKRLLGAQGIATEVRFGVRKEADQFLAHAWLEFEGQSIELGHDGKEEFSPLASLE